MLREAVRRRAASDGDPDQAICERCDAAPVRATHHLTYERVGREDLDDLLGVCSDCHEFLSGKAENDPLHLRAVEAMDEVEECTRSARASWMHGDGVGHARPEMEAAAFAARVAQYRMLRWAAATAELPVTATSIWLLQCPGDATPALSLAWIGRFSEVDRAFAGFSQRRAG